MGIPFRSRRNVQLALTTMVVSLLSHSLFADNQGYYRQPAIHQDVVVFVAEGDLWTVSAAGGLARRLTSHLDAESQPAISPNGSMVAFSARYEGATEVYTMPIEGGSPSRWTWEQDPSVVVGWPSDGELLYATRALSTSPSWLLVKIDLELQTRAPLPLFEASQGTVAADGSVYFARPGWHANNTKRYQGGTARNLWRFGPGQSEATNLTADHPGENSDPMAWQGRVFFLTDRDGTMNIWSMAGDGGDLQQHTRHSGWDVKGASVGPHGQEGAIVYQLGADVWKLDLGSGETGPLDIRLASDFDQLRQRWVDDPLASMTAMSLSAKGDRVVTTTRGQVFVLPVQHGRRVEIAPANGVRYRSATFMPDGENILLLSDESGEQEFYLAPANGVGSAVQVTSSSEILNYGATPSPDGKQIVYSDRANDLWVVTVADGNRRKVNDLEEGVGDAVWTPDSRWLIWERAATNTYTQLVLTDTSATGAAFSPGVPLTSQRVNSFSPAISPDGNWLYFLSDRHLQSLVPGPWGARQPEPFFDATNKVYQIALQRGLRPVFREPDELMPKEDRDQETENDGRQERDDEAGDAGGDEGPDEDAAPTPVPIDVDDIQQRVWEVPVSPGNYRSLTVAEKHLFMTRRDSGPSPKTHLISVSLSWDDVEDGAPKTEILTRDIRSYDLSLNRKKLLIRREGGLFVINAKPGKVELPKHRVNTKNFRFSISRRQDFRQLFLDAWRLERDFFYDPDMHGVDWEAVRDKYLPLVDRVSSRDELNDLIGEVVGELSALHISVRGGDLRRGDDQLAVPSLGARLRRDASRSGFVIEHIYRTDPDYPEWRGPLADPYLDVEAGDVVLSINGRPTIEHRQLGALLLGAADQQVLVELQDHSAGRKREIVVVPTTQEHELRYQDWELARRLETEARSDGKIGYVHLRAMGSRNLSEWYRNFYPVFDRPGLIIDVRDNRGGNIDSIILEKLLRKAWFYWAPRNGQPSWNMQYAFRGHMAVLVNSQTASDGEAFAEGFRRLGLGKVIGQRTWGGEIWLSSNNRLSDGGIARAPQTGVYADGEWLIEGWGVVPDIEVDNLPKETFDGRDRQLETAVDHLMQLIAEDPRPVPSPPPYPDKSFDYPRNQ